MQSNRRPSTVRDENPLPPRGSILLYRSKNLLTMTPLSFVNHLAFMVDGGETIHLMYTGIKKLSFERLETSRTAKMTCIGYFKILHEPLADKIVQVCNGLYEHRDRFGYMTWKSGLQIGRLVNPFLRCVSPQASQKCHQQNLALFRTIQSLLHNRETTRNVVAVCSTFVFTVLLFSIFSIDPGHPLLWRLHPTTCHPDNILDLLFLVKQQKKKANGSPQPQFSCFDPPPPR